MFVKYFIQSIISTSIAMGISPPLSHNHSLRRIRIVRTRPSRRPARLIIAVDDANDRPVGTGDHEERSRDDDEDGPEHHEHPLGRLFHLALAPVVVKPHAAHGLEADEGAEEGADEGDETAEDGDGAGDDVGDAGAATGASDPGHPVDLGVARKVVGSSQEADEEVLGGELMKMLVFDDY